MIKAYFICDDGSELSLTIAQVPSIGDRIMWQTNPSIISMRVRDILWTLGNVKNVVTNEIEMDVIVYLEES